MNIIKTHTKRGKLGRMFKVKWWAVYEQIPTHKPSKKRKQHFIDAFKAITW